MHTPPAAGCGARRQGPYMARMRTHPPPSVPKSMRCQLHSPRRAHTPDGPPPTSRKGSERKAPHHLPQGRLPARTTQTCCAPPPPREVVIMKQTAAPLPGDKGLLGQHSGRRAAAGADLGGGETGGGRQERPPGRRGGAHAARAAPPARWLGAPVPVSHPSSLLARAGNAVMLHPRGWSARPCAGHGVGAGARKGRATAAMCRAKGARHPARVTPRAVPVPAPFRPERARSTVFAMSPATTYR